MHKKRRKKRTTQRIIATSLHKELLELLPNNTFAHKNFTILADNSQRSIIITKDGVLIKLLDHNFQTMVDYNDPHLTDTIVNILTKLAPLATPNRGPFGKPNKGQKDESARENNIR